ncbi:putative MFS-type transporter [Acinetobacter lwoffii]|nr:putative MFS-type transporter [Acinetobacter lwoffii]
MGFSARLLYACSAFAYIPHSLFWIDYLSQQLGLSLFWINFNWILYGLGSALGALSAYALARKWGNFAALKILYSLYIVAIFIATLDASPLLTFSSSFFTGMLNPAVVFLTSYTILQLYGLAYKKLWSIATLCFASIQLIGGLSFSALQYFGLSYHQQFILATLVLLLGTLQLFWCTRLARLKPEQQTQPVSTHGEGTK